MSIQISIPGSLSKFTQGNTEINVQANNVSDALHELAENFPSLGKQIFAEEGIVRGFINIFLNSQDIRYLDKGDTRVFSGDVITLIPAIAGG